jgi:hypothetical protein
MSELEHAVLNYSVDEVDSIIRNIVPNFRSEQRGPTTMNAYSHHGYIKKDAQPLQEFYQDIPDA